MLLKISQLKSYNSFRSFLYRKLRGCRALHLDSLIKYLVKSFCDDTFFSLISDQTTYITKKNFFGKESGFREWINTLHHAGVVHRVGRVSSVFRLGVSGKKYLNKILNEIKLGIEQNKEELYKPDKAVNEGASEMEKLRKELQELDDRFNQVIANQEKMIAMMTPEQKEKACHLRIVKGENHEY